MYDIDNSTFIYTSQEIDLIASKIEAKINYTHCCTELPCGDEIWLKAQETDRFLFKEWYDELKQAMFYNYG
jgi:hypothetical protein